MTIAFRIEGKASPAGSKRAFIYNPKGGGPPKAAVTDACKDSRMFKNLVADCARHAYNGPLLIGPVALTVVFHVARPKGHYGSGRNAAKVKDSSPPFPTGKPDLLKLARAIEDAITGIIWRDDSQIVVEKLVKVYDDHHETLVRIEELTEDGGRIDL